MRFLYGSALTTSIKDLCGTPGRIDLAIAYWGSQALTLLPVKPSRRDARVVCCLRGGKSAPEVIGKFGKRARQCDNLHAKVIWTPTVDGSLRDVQMLAGHTNLRTTQRIDANPEAQARIVELV
jgi:hypothetical protein